MNILVLVGGYALYITTLKSIFIIPIIGLMATGVILKKIKFKFQFQDWKITVLLTSLFSVLSLLLFFRNNELLILDNDYLFWIRVAVTNQEYGVENINVFYNLIDASYHNSDLYHYLELWTMNLGNALNGQEPAFNFLLFVYPLGLIISCLGIKELLLNIIPSKIDKNYFLAMSSFFIIIGFLFFSQPWDFLNSYLKIGHMPISGMGLAWGSIKMIFLMNIVIALFLYLQKPNSNKFITLLFTTFFYLPVLPILMLTLFIWWCYLYFSGSKTELKDIIILISLSIGFIFYYFVNGNHGGTTVSGFSIKEWFSLSNWIKYCPAIAMKTIFIPIFGFFPIYFLILRKRVSIKSKPFLFMILLYSICIAVWAAFIKNIDANQAFLLFFGAILPLLMLLGLWNLIFVKRSPILGFLLVNIYLIPGIIHASKYNNQIKKDQVSTIDYIQKLDNARVLYIPDKTELNSVYDYNERVYTGMNQFILYNSKVDLISVAASFDGNYLKNNALEMYTFYRDISSYYKQCGYFDVSSKCFKDFIRNCKINVICTKNKEMHVEGWAKDFENSDYSFYKILP
ncbi:hypothetical protein [Flavobacterium luteum]|uniref:Uncharacterized protein n=1 Tax=Flavobacterium luteum TaxID=2026654 RepID=A0A7J5AE49_9FLAO|nr:hypothetical protein [Flavobacterium luteum]KAB1155815.1 hypothetical protein F6464_09840 [Flavobacterium luteum]